MQSKSIRPHEPFSQRQMIVLYACGIWTHVVVSEPLKVMSVKFSKYYHCHQNSSLTKMTSKRTRITTQILSTKTQPTISTQANNLTTIYTQMTNAPVLHIRTTALAHLARSPTHLSSQTIRIDQIHHSTC